MTKSAARTHQDRVHDQLVETADLLMKLCEQAGVSQSPSVIRHRLADVIGDACSQSTVRRLRANLLSYDSLVRQRAAGTPESTDCFSVFGTFQPPRYEQ